MNTKRRKTIMIVVLSILVTFMSAGFAILSSKININSSNNFKGKWDVHIKDISVSSKNGIASSNFINIQEDRLGANLSVNLYNNDDYIEYLVVVENSGNIPAKLTNVTEDKSFSDDTYLSITNASKDLINTTINPSSTMQILLKFKLNNPNNDVLTEVIGGHYNFILDFVQDTGV